MTAIVHDDEEFRAAARVVAEALNENHEAMTLFGQSLLEIPQLVEMGEPYTSDDIVDTLVDALAVQTAADQD